MQFCHNFLYRCVSDAAGPHSPPKRQCENTRDTCCVVCGLPLICQRCVVVLSAGGPGGFVRRRSLPAMPEGTVCHGLSFHRERASARTVIWHKWKSKVWLLHRCPLPGFHHDIPRSVWSIPGAITVSWSLNVSPVWVIFPSLKEAGGKKRCLYPTAQTSFYVLVVFVVVGDFTAVISIRKLISRDCLRTCTTSTVFLMTRSMSERCMERRLSRSDWNWNHFIMNHYGKCCASVGAINIVKHEPSTVYTINDTLAACYFRATVYCKLVFAELLRIYEKPMYWFLCLLFFLLLMKSLCTNISLH